MFERCGIAVDSWNRLISSSCQVVTGGYMSVASKSEGEYRHLAGEEESQS